jgi:hypothetical protein
MFREIRKMDSSPESNPKYPINQADPAKVAYHYKASIVNKKEWDAKILRIKSYLEILDNAVKELEDFSFLVGVEHRHTKDE